MKIRLDNKRWFNFYRLVGLMGRAKNKINTRWHVTLFGVQLIVSRITAK